MKKDCKLKEVETLPFEKALERLESIIEKMESGKLQLDEMMKYFAVKSFHVLSSAI